MSVNKPRDFRTHQYRRMFRSKGAYICKRMRKEKNFIWVRFIYNQRVNAHFLYKESPWRCHTFNFSNQACDKLTLSDTRSKSSRAYQRIDVHSHHSSLDIHSDHTYCPVHLVHRGNPFSYRILCPVEYTFPIHNRILFWGRIV